MDFRQIEAFMYVVRLKSFSRAADAIFLTQPTISAHISTLENELGVKLIDRSGKEVAPTKAGKIFYDYANNLVNIRDNAIFTLSEFSNKIEGKVEIAASTVPSQYILPQLMSDFLKKYKNISFSISQLDSRQVVDEILDKSIDLGFVGTMIESNKLIYHRLVDDKLVLITPNNKKFGDINSADITFDQVQNEKFIFRESGSGTRQEFERILSTNGINPKTIDVIAQMNSIEAIKQSVSVGLGVSIASLISVEDYIKFGLIKAFNITGFNLNRAFYLVYHKNKPISPLNNAFLNFVLKNFESK